MRHYELLIVLPGTMTEEEIGPVIEKINEILDSSGAKNIEMQDMGKTRLAYPIKHIRYGYYRMFRFEAEGPEVPQAQSKLRLLSEPLRSIIQLVSGDAPKKNIDLSGETISAIEVRTKTNKRQKPQPTLAPESQESEKESQSTHQKKEEKGDENNEEKTIDMKEIDKKLDDLLDAKGTDEIADL